MLNQSLTILKTAHVITTSLALTACGGGGDSGSVTPVSPSTKHCIS